MGADRPIRINKKSTRDTEDRKVNFHDQDFTELVKKWVNDDISYETLKKEYKSREEQLLPKLIYKLIARQQSF